MPSIYAPSLLAYPGNRLPGFNPTHPAAGQMVPGRGLCAIARGTNFINLINGAKGTAGATPPTSAMGQRVGPAAVFSGNATSNTVTFAGNKGVGNEVNVTLAAIWQQTAAPGTNQEYVGNNSSAGLHLLSTTSGTSLVLEDFNGFTVATPSPVLVPASGSSYFCAVSTNGAAQNFVLLTLNNGKLLTATAATALTATLSNGTYNIGAQAATTNGPSANIAAAMWSPTFLSLRQLTAWAADPWAFWYPRNVTDTLFYSLAHPGGADVLYPQSVM